MLSSTIPIFPLHNVVLFPGIFLPLYIFEPRYREMVAHALEGNQLIGIVLLQSCDKAMTDAHQPIYPIGCVGRITHADRLADGCYNIILHGLEKFRIIAEEPTTHPYRIARTEPLSEPDDGNNNPVLIRSARKRLETILFQSSESLSNEIKISPSMADTDLVNSLSQYLELEPVERQALLEREGLLERCLTLIEILEMKTLADKWGRQTDVLH